MHEWIKEKNKQNVKKNTKKIRIVCNAIRECDILVEQ